MYLMFCVFVKYTIPYFWTDHLKKIEAGRQQIQNANFFFAQNFFKILHFDKNDFSFLYDVGKRRTKSLVSLIICLLNKLLFATPQFVNKL